MEEEFPSALAALEAFPVKLVTASPKDGGRHLVAKRCIKAGETLLESTPFPSAAVLMDDLLTTHCYHCFTKCAGGDGGDGGDGGGGGGDSGSGDSGGGDSGGGDDSDGHGSAEEKSMTSRLCSGCSVISYCSDECRDVENALHTSAGECATLRLLHELNIEGGGTLSIRLLIRMTCGRAVKELKGEDINNDDVSNQKHDMTGVEGKAGVTVSGGDAGRGGGGEMGKGEDAGERSESSAYNYLFSFKEVQRLETHVQEVPPEVLESVKEVAKAVARIMPPQLSKGSGKVSKVKSKELTALFFAIQCNAHGIKSNAGESGGSSAVKGLGMFPLASLVNHSCIPNCHHHFVSGIRGRPPILVFQATADIGVGEEIRYSYVDLYLGTMERRQVAAQAYFFDCTCKRCADTDAALSAAKGGGRTLSLSLDTKVLCDLAIDSAACSNSQCADESIDSCGGARCHDSNGEDSEHGIPKTGGSVRSGGGGGVMVPGRGSAEVRCSACGGTEEVGAYIRRLSAATTRAEHGMRLAQAVMSKKPFATMQQVAMAKAALLRIRQDSVDGSGLHQRHRVVYNATSLLLEVITMELTMEEQTNNAEENRRARTADVAIPLLHEQLGYLDYLVGCLEDCLGGNHPELAALYDRAAIAFARLGELGVVELTSTSEEGGGEDRAACTYAYLVPPPPSSTGDARVTSTKRLAMELIDKARVMHAVCYGLLSQQDGY